MPEWSGRPRRSRRLGRLSLKKGSDPSPSNASDANSALHFRAAERAFGRLVAKQRGSCTHRESTERQAVISRPVFLIVDYIGLWIIRSQRQRTRSHCSIDFNARLFERQALQLGDFRLKLRALETGSSNQSTVFWPLWRGKFRCDGP
jgi:hypothetical protein